MNLIQGLLRLYEINGYKNLRRNEVEALQKKKLHRLIGFVAKNSSYYSEIIETKKINLEKYNLDEFPVLSKSDLTSNFDRIVTDKELTLSKCEKFIAESDNPTDLLDRKYVVAHTAGTSGKPTVIACNINEWMYGYTNFNRIYPPPKLEKRRVAHIGATGGHFGGVTISRTTDWIPVLNKLLKVKEFDINVPWQQFIADLNEYNPTQLGVYPSIIKDLAIAQENGDLNISPHFITCAGEPLSLQDRDRITKAFNTQVYNLYSSTETIAMGIVYPDSEELILFEEDFIFEIKEDHLLVTNLFNYTTPLIRYRLNDVLTLADQPSGTKHTIYPGLRRAKSIVGRFEDKLVLKNKSGKEDFIHPLFIIASFLVQGIIGFQIVRKNNARFDFSVQLSNDLNKQEIEDLLKRIHDRWNGILLQKDMNNVEYKVITVDFFGNDPLSPKRKLVVDESTGQ